MGIFDELIAEKANEYRVANVLTEMEGGDMGGGAMTGEMDAEMPTPDQQDSAPTPEVGAETKPIDYNKPYQDLAILLYQAIRTDFSELNDEQQKQVLQMHPDNIDSDEKGANAFSVWEDIYNERTGVAPNDVDVTPAEGPGVQSI
jgi:hypothetical protein